MNVVIDDAGAIKQCVIRQPPGDPDSVKLLRANQGRVDGDLQTLNDDPVVTINAQDLPGITRGGAVELNLRSVANDVCPWLRRHRGPTGVSVDDAIVRGGRRKPDNGSRCGCAKGGDNRRAIVREAVAFRTVVHHVGDVGRDTRIRYPSCPIPTLEYIRRLVEAERLADDWDRESRVGCTVWAREDADLSPSNRQTCENEKSTKEK